MKVRHQLQRRIAASAACARLHAEWWREAGLPASTMLVLPLQGRCVWASRRIGPGAA